MVISSNFLKQEMGIQRTSSRLTCPEDSLSLLGWFPNPTGLGSSEDQSFYAHRLQWPVPHLKGTQWSLLWCWHWTPETQQLVAEQHTLARSFDHVSQASHLNDVREERQRQWHTFLIEHNGHLTPITMCTQTNTLAFKYSVDLRAAGEMVPCLRLSEYCSSGGHIWWLNYPDPGDRCLSLCGYLHSCAHSHTLV